jgi:DNA-binding IclR family transcriptional regulator/peroxiredoxin
MGKSQPDQEPHPLIAQLVGLSAPTIVLPWTTCVEFHDELGSAANMSLADLAERHTLVVYFTPAEDEGDGPSADTMSRVYRANEHGITQLGARTVGVSAQPALEQEQLAVNEEFSHWMLADDKLALADDLVLPTVEINGRDEYEPLALIIRDKVIVHVVYPIASPGSHIDDVLRWLAQNDQGPTQPHSGGGLLGLAQAYLEQLRDESTHTVSLAVLDGTEIICIRCLPSSTNVPSIARTGSDVRLPAYCTALGKVLLAFQPEEEREQLVTGITLERRTETTFTDPQELRSELEQIRDSAFAISDGEYMPDLQAIAVGVRNRSGEVIASIGVSAQSFDEPFEPELISPQVGYLKEAADAISAWLGRRS